MKKVKSTTRRKEGEEVMTIESSSSASASGDGDVHDEDGDGDANRRCGVGIEESSSKLSESEPSSSDSSSSDDDDDDFSSASSSNGGGGEGEGELEGGDGGPTTSSQSQSKGRSDNDRSSTVDVDVVAGEGVDLKRRVVPLSDDSDTDSDHDDDEEGDEVRGRPSSPSKSSIRINRKYAEEYNLRKGREELARYDKTKRTSRVSFADDGEESDGSYSSSSSSSSEEEDEMGELLTPDLDLKIVRTIRALRERDERVYDRNVDFFAAAGGGDGDDDDEGDDDIDDGSPGNATKTGGGKKKRIKDVIREQILERMHGDDEDHDDEGAEAGDDARGGGLQGKGGHRLAYDAEQERIRGDFIRSTATDGGRSGGEDHDDADDAADDDEGDGLLLVKKSKRGDGEDRSTAAQDLLRREMETLKGGSGGGDDDDDDDVVVDPHGEVEDGEKFLRDFVLNRRWIDRTVVEASDDLSSDDGAAHGPLMKRVAGAGANDSDEREVDDTSSIEDLDRMDAFESRYNFRFEEAEAEGPATAVDDRYRIVGYARGNTAAAGDSLRRPDETRKRKRAKRKERKIAERKAKEEQLRRLKNARREAMREKLEKVRQVSGMMTSAGATDGAAEGDQPRLSEEALAQLLEGDYDPDKFSKIMEGDLYGDDYYRRGDGEWKSDADVRDSMLRDATALSVDEEDYGNAYDEYGDPDGQDDGDEDHYNDGDHGGPEFDDGAGDGDGEELQQHDEDSSFLNDDDREATGDNRQRPESEIEKQVKAKMLDELYKLDYEDLIGDMPCRFKYRKVEPNTYGLSCEEILFANDSTLRGFVSLKKMSAYRDEGEHRVGSRKRKRFRQALKADYEKHLEQSNELENAVHLPNKRAESKQESGKETIQSSKKRRRRQKKGKGKMESSTCLAKPQHGHPEVASESCVASAPQSEVGRLNTEEGEQKRKRKKKGKKKSKTTAEESDGNQNANAETKAGAEDGEDGERGKSSVDDKKQHKRKRNKSVSRKNGALAGVPASRLASYGL